MTPFNILYNIPKRKLHTKEEVEANLNIYLLLQFFKTDNMMVQLVEYLNHNYQLKIYDMYLFIYYTIPAQINYIKGDVTNRNKENKQLKELELYYNCNTDIAQDYIKFLSKQKLDYIKEFNDFKKRI